MKTERTFKIIGGVNPEMMLNVMESTINGHFYKDKADRAKDPIKLEDIFESMSPEKIESIKSALDASAVTYRVTIALESEE